MSAPAHIARENGKKGGRPAGSKSKKTLERELVLEEFRKRVSSHVDILFDAQLTLARGQNYLFKIEKELQIGPKGGKRYVNSRPQLVIDKNEIESYLANEFEEGSVDDENDPHATYYYITAKEPNNQAIDALLDRTFGRSTQRMEHTGEDGGPIKLEGVDVAIRK